MAGLSDTEIERLREKYKELGNYRKAAEELGHSPQTAKKYTEDLREDSENNEEGEGSNGSNGGDGDVNGEDEKLDFKNAFATQSEVKKDVSFTLMSPGEFIEWFFEEDLSESPVKNAGVFADRCNAKQAIPTEGKMKEVLMDLSSKQGYGNPRQQKWVAELYWGRARDYASAHLDMSASEVDQYVAQNDGDWIAIMQDRDNRSRQSGQNRSHRESVIRPGGQVHPGEPVGNRQDSGLSSQIDELIRLEEKKQRLAEALGMSGPGEQIAALNERIASLEEQLASGGVGAGSEESDPYANFPENAARPVQIAWMMDQAGVSEDRAEKLVEEQQDPEVQEIQFERYKFNENREFWRDMAKMFTSEYSLDSLADKVTGQGGGGTATVDSNLNVMACPDCGAEQEIDPNSPGFECNTCGAEVDSCPQCRSRMTLPPVGEEPGAICPDCGRLADRSGTGYSCTQCDWSGSRAEAQAGVVVCESCNASVPRVSEADADKTPAGGLNA